MLYTGNIKTLKNELKKKEIDEVWCIVRSLHTRSNGSTGKI